MVNADIVFRKLHNNEIDDVPIEEGNVIYDLDTKQIFVDDVVDGVLKRVRYGGSEKLIDAIISANTTTKTIYDDTITTDSIIRVYVDEDDNFTYNSISTASGSVTITFNAMTQDVPIKIGIGAVSEFHQLITEGQASDISYNNGQSGMTATDVQEAIDELKSDLGNIELTADNVEYDNVTSGLQATNVQDAVDEITDNLTATRYTDTNATTLEALTNSFINSIHSSMLEMSTIRRKITNNNDLWYGIEITKNGVSLYNGIILNLSNAEDRYTFRSSIGSGGASTVISPFKGGTHYYHYWLQLGDNTDYDKRFTASSDCTAILDMISNYGTKQIYKNSTQIANGNTTNLVIDLIKNDVLRIYVNMDSGSRIGLVSCTIVSDNEIKNIFV